MKVLIDVVVLHTIDGELVPMKIIWKDNRVFEIDKVLEVRRKASLKAGGFGLRYTCRINRQLKYIWLENLPEGGSHWFVEGK